MADSLPVGAPEVTPLPTVAKTVFCLDEQGANTLCTAEQASACAAPGTGGVAGCVQAGPGWQDPVCPPGFIGAAQAETPGELPGCTPDPAQCGSDPYGDAQLANGQLVRFVDATTGSDAAAGTREAPLASVAAAVKSIGSGGIIALAKGIYPESVVLTKSVSLRGRCAALVKLGGKAGAPVLAVVPPKIGSTVSVRGITLVGPALGVQAVGNVALSLEHLWILGLQETALVLEGSAVAGQVHSVVVDGTLGNGAGQFGGGVEVRKGAQLAGGDLRIRASRWRGLMAGSKGTLVHLDRVLIDNTLGQSSDGKMGYGVVAALDAQVHLARARLSGNRSAGLIATGSNTEVALTQTIVDGTRSEKSSGGLGMGIDVSGGAKVTLSAVRLTGNRSLGIGVVDGKSTVQASALLVDGTSGTLAAPDQAAGIGVTNGGQISLWHTRVSANRSNGIYAQGAATVATATGLLVDGNLPGQASGQFGYGINVRDGAALTIERARVSANRTAGVTAVGTGTQFKASKLCVDGTQPMASDQHFGQGIAVAEGAHAHLVDARLSHNFLAGLWLGNGEVRAERLIADHNKPRPYNGTMGHGVAIGSEAGGKLMLMGARLTANHSAGLGAYAGASVRAIGVLVDGTLFEPSTTASGQGVATVGAESFHLAGSAVIDNAGSGAVLANAKLGQFIGVVAAGSRGDSQGGNGNGLVLFDETGPYDVTSCIAADNRGAALMAIATVSSRIRDTVLASTRPGEQLLAQGALLPMADGLISESCDKLQVERVVAANNARAGLHLRNVGVASILGSVASGGIFGLALLGQNQPTMTGSSFAGSQQGVAGGAGLSVPPPPKLVLPQW